MWKISFVLAKQIQLEYSQSNSKGLYCLLPPAIQSLTIRSYRSSGRKVQTRIHVPVRSSRNHKSKSDCPGSQSRFWETLPSQSHFTSLVAIWKMACCLDRELIQAHGTGTRRSLKATWVWGSLQLGIAFSTESMKWTQTTHSSVFLEKKPSASFSCKEVLVSPLDSCQRLD